MRHAKKTVVTVRVDELVFYQPIQVGQLVVCEAELVFVGRTSMEVLVTVKYENMTDDEPCRVALTAYFTYVAIDENRKPCPVPGLLTDTEEEKKAFELGRQRYEDHKRKGK